MDKQDFIKHINKHFPDDVIDTTINKEKRVTVDIKPAAILKVSGHLFNELELRFIIASAFHTKKGFEILYHFSDDTEGNIINIHVILPEEKPEVESLANMLSGANWIEREMSELLGITFLNHPEPEKLISEGNWAEGVYPYRKNFK
ncbi:MAG: NADH-quinone oxidoreductase subunit C [Bacteroidales bacterium]|nr:NADH-quinone oxidoreductase subunit C [Bacteroidales bacterium]